MPLEIVCFDKVKKILKKKNKRENKDHLDILRNIKNDRKTNCSQYIINY
ncbi:hypothetical protein OAB83_01270 [Candidatus Pelagibacter sp.]|nr:hypothetical protein [Candidatus Pelagibacter sp.]